MKAPARPAAAHRRPSRFARFARTRVGPPPLGRRRRGRSRGSGRRGRRGVRAYAGRPRTPRGNDASGQDVRKSRTGRGDRPAARSHKPAPTRARRSPPAACSRASHPPSSSSSAGSRERSRRASSDNDRPRDEEDEEGGAETGGGRPRPTARARRRVLDRRLAAPRRGSASGDGRVGRARRQRGSVLRHKNPERGKRRSLGETGEVEEGRGEATATTRPSEAVRRGRARGSAGDGGGRRRGRERPHRPPVRGASASLFRGVQDAPRVSRHFSERENTTTRVCRFEVPLQRRARSALDRCAGPCARRRHGFSVPRHLAGRGAARLPPPRRLDGSAFHTLRLHRAPHGGRKRERPANERAAAPASPKRARASDAPGPPPHVPTWAMNPARPCRTALRGRRAWRRGSTARHSWRKHSWRGRRRSRLPPRRPSPSPPTAALVCHPPSRPSVRRRRARRRRPTRA